MREKTILKTPAKKKKKTAFIATCLFVLFGYRYFYFFFFWWKILWNAHFYLISLRLESGLFSFSRLYVPFIIVQQM